MGNRRKKYFDRFNNWPMVVFSLTLLLFSIQCSSVRPAPEKPSRTDLDYAKKYLDWSIREAIRLYGVKGAAVVVVDHGGILYSNVYGTADAGGRTPVTLDTFFRVGSISKTITALAVMKLAEQGRLDIDAPIDAYVPGLAMKTRSDASTQCTIRELLSHKGGIIRDYYSGIMGGFRQSPDELLSVLSDEYYCYTPGTAFKYSNLGYTLLGIAIERVTGMKFEDYVRNEVLIPLGMTISSFTLTPAIESALATGFMPPSLSLLPQAGGARELSPARYLELRDIPAGGLLSNARDLAAYLSFLLSDKDRGNRVVGNSTFSRMLEVQFPDVDEYSLLHYDYGLGFMRNVIGYEGVEDIAGHDGDVNGFSSAILFSPSAGLGIAILTNCESLFLRIYDIMSRSLKYFLEARMGRVIEPILPVSVEPAAVTASEVAAHAGTYAMIGASMEISPRGKELDVKVSASDVGLILLPITRDLYEAKARFLCLDVDIAGLAGLDKIYVHFISTRTNDYLIVDAMAGYAHVMLPLVRMRAWPLPDYMKPYMGTYRIVRDERNSEVLDLYLPTDEYELIARNGFLTFRSRNLPVEVSLTMIPVNEREAVIAGSGETVFFSRGDTISFSGFDIKRID